MTDPKQPKQTGLPEDAGNQMSDRAGYYDESESGQTGVPTGTGGAGVPAGDLPEDVLDKDGSGTSFDAGNEIPGR